MSPFARIVVISFALAACGRTSHHDSAAAPAPPAPPVVVAQPDGTLLVTANMQQWQLNDVGVDAGKPDSVIGNFSYVAQDGVYLSYGYEQKSVHNCIDLGDFIYQMTIRDVNATAGAKTVTLDDCFELPAGTYQLAVSLNNINRCEGLDLSFGFLTKSNCTAP